MPAISALAAPVFNWTTIVTGALMTQAHINADWTLATTKVTELQSVVADLEKCYANAAAPTDKPAGKFWFDSANLVMKYYEVASGQLRTVATLDKAETFTNKTITSPSIGGTVAGGASYTSPTLATPKISGLLDQTTWPIMSVKGTDSYSQGSPAAKVPFNTKITDTNSNYDTTLYRYTPPLGYYLVHVILYMGIPANPSTVTLMLYKNGVADDNFLCVATLPSFGHSYTITGPIYLNGTDYIEVFASSAPYGTVIYPASSRFSACRIA